VADITDPAAIRFVNEVIRPHAEKFRALKATCDSALTTWWNGISDNVPNSSDPVADGREAEGVSRLTGANVNLFVIQMALFQTAMNVDGVKQIIDKPCVRSLEVTL
jgi:hypothetical protein